MVRGTVEEEKGVICVGGGVKVGRPADWGETTDVGGLVGERNPVGNALGGELAHLSTCSGFTGVVAGLVGSWGGGFLVGGGVAVCGVVLSTGVVVVLVSEALD